MRMTHDGAPQPSWVMPTRWESAFLIGGTWKYSRRWQWRLAWLVDATHRPVQILAFTGWFLLPQWLFATFVGIAMMLQAALATCPLVVLADALRARVRRQQPRRGTVANTFRGRADRQGFCFTLGLGVLLIGAAEIVGWMPSPWPLAAVISG